MSKSNKAEVAPKAEVVAPVATPAAPATKSAKSGKGGRLAKKTDKPKTPKAKTPKAKTGPGRGHAAGVYAFEGGKVIKPFVKRVSTSLTATGNARGSVTLKSGRTLSKSQVLRWFGYNGYGRDETVSACLKLGFDLTSGNIGGQWGSGTRQAAVGIDAYPGEPAPVELDKGEAAELVGLTK